MPAIAGLLLTLAQWLIGSKTGRIVALVMLGIAAFGTYTLVIEHRAASEAAAKVTAREKAASEAEHTRREQALEAAQRVGATLAARLADQEKKNGVLLAKLNRQSAARDSAPCLDASQLGRLQQLR